MHNCRNNIFQLCVTLFLTKEAEMWRPMTKTGSHIRSTFILAESHLISNKTKNTHFLFTIEKGEFSNSHDLENIIFFFLSLCLSLWLGIVTLKHPEARNCRRKWQKRERNRQHVQRRNYVEVHLLLSRSRHGEVRLQQNRYFSTEKEWIKWNIKKEIRSDFQLKYNITYIPI